MSVSINIAEYQCVLQVFISFFDPETYGHYFGSYNHITTINAPRLLVPQKHFPKLFLSPVFVLISQNSYLLILTYLGLQLSHDKATASQKIALTDQRFHKQARFFLLICLHCL